MGGQKYNVTELSQKLEEITSLNITETHDITLEFPPGIYIGTITFTFEEETFKEEDLEKAKATIRSSMNWDDDFQDDPQGEHAAFIIIEEDAPDSLFDELGVEKQPRN